MTNIPRSRPATVAVVCHDTGAALALAAFAADRAADAFSLRTVCSGPACGVFRSDSRIADIELAQELSTVAADELVRSLVPDAVLMGTSFDSWTERRIIDAARRRGIFTVGLVDWWSNFGRRFSTPGSNDLRFLPDVVAVMDADARSGCIADGIPARLVQVTGNPYWDRLADSGRYIIARYREEVRRRIGIGSDVLLGLIISSNLRNIGMGLGYDESDFFAAIRPLPTNTDEGRQAAWIVKPHPKESPAELRAVIETAGLALPFVENATAIELVASSDMVIGMCSSVLLEAAILGRTVVSLQPGMDRTKMHYLRIFDHLGIPKIVDAGEAGAVLRRMVNGGLAAPSLDRIPFPIGKGRAAAAIGRLLEDGIRATHEGT